ncbi:hypothetical protein DEO72_LG6g1509 [Vigna unguiculata]|uniref:Uncharacterized protein n=1 Tax=Vigna unguiculata TaxID=3917 RepID=A0A4D6M5X7_VIGUN|nr:hypothetical protein DEO72_LG6g1509 [Vigna unguiculata]
MTTEKQYNVCTCKKGLNKVVFDYDDLVKIPYFRSEIESLTEEAPQLRSGVSGEVGNQQVHLPLILPKVPGRFYYYFGKPLETKADSYTEASTRQHSIQPPLYQCL